MTMGEPQVRDQPEPSPGDPALSDEVTAQLHAFSVRQARALVLAMAFVSVFFGAALWVLLARLDLADTFPPLYSNALWLTLFAAVTLSHRRTPPVAIRPMWRGSLRRLLATRSWRETPAKVLNTRGTVLVLPGGEYIRVSRLPAAVREVVVWAGRVRLVGPDDDGRLAVRVDGLSTVWSARRVPPTPGTAALPSGEPIATMWVRRFVERIRAVYIAAILFTALSLILVVMPGPWWNVLTLASYSFAAVAIGLRVRYLARLQSTGTWIQTEATAPSWRARRNGLADGTVTLSFPDGRRFTVQLDRAPLDLFTNVVRERSLWVAQNWVVGYPHYPNVATARFTPVPA